MDTTTELVARAIAHVSGCLPKHLAPPCEQTLDGELMCDCLREAQTAIAAHNEVLRERLDAEAAKPINGHTSNWTSGFRAALGRVKLILEGEQMGRWIAPYMGDVEICHAHMDGDCTWEKCPQNRDGEPYKTGRHCPLDTWDEEGE